MTNEDFNLINCFYYEYPGIENDIEDIVELYDLTLYIKFKNGNEYVYYYRIDELINITNNEYLTDDIKQHRFRTIMAKCMKEKSLSQEAVARRIRSYTTNS